MTYEEIYWKLNNHLIMLEETNQNISDDIIGLLEWFELAMNNKTPLQYPTEEAFEDWKKNALTFLPKD